MVYLISQQSRKQGITENRWDKEKTKTVDLNPTTLIIINVNGLNIPVKRQRLSDLWLK